MDILDDMGGEYIISKSFFFFKVNYSFNSLKLTLYDEHLFKCRKFI